jgi:hypothetical protein
MAVYTWVGLTDDWSTGNNWSPTAPAGGPLGSDTATINNAQPCRVTANSNCLTLNFTGFTSSFRIENGVTLTVFGGAITLDSGMTYDQTTTGILSTKGNQNSITITFAGITIPNLRIGKTSVASTQTVIISGTTPTIKNLIVTNDNTNSTTTLSGTPVTITSSLNVNGTGPLTGTLLTFVGTCTISTSSSTGYINNGFTVTTGSSLQMLSTIYMGAGTITFNGTATLNPGTFALFYSTTSSASIDSGSVTWYDVSFNVNGGTLTLLSNLNVSRDFGCLNSTFTGAFSINIGRNANLIGTSSTLNSATTINLIGTGSLLISTIHNGGTININTANPSGYTLGNVTYPTTFLSGAAFNLVGTSVAQVYSTTAHTLRVATTAVISTNNTATGANIVGGSEIIYGNLLVNNSIGQFTYESTFLGNLTTLGNAIINGAKIKGAGNLSSGTSLTGTSTIELDGSANATWGVGTYQNNIIVNKSGGAVVTTGAGTITWGLASRTLTINSPINFLTNSTTLTLANATPVTIVNTFGSPFFNITMPNITLNINGADIRINSNLTLSALGATFAGAFGWDCNNLICSTAGTFNITLQQLVSYRTRTAVSITGGTSANRPTMRSSDATNRAIWTLDFGATQSMIYVNGLRIDSSGGQTIWSFGVLTTDVNTSINWNPGVPLRTVAYAFVS